MIRILIVDDHQMFIDGLKTLLKNAEGIEVCGEALNGKQASEWLAENNADLVITDIEMPEMNGIELTRHIKATYPNTSVLVLTMYNERGIIETIAEAEAEGYILKNTGKLELLTAIRRISQGTSYYSKEVIEVLSTLQKEKKIKQENVQELTEREK